MSGLENKDDSIFHKSVRECIHILTFCCVVTQGEGAGEGGRGRERGRGRGGEGKGEGKGGKGKGEEQLTHTHTIGFSLSELLNCKCVICLQSHLANALKTVSGKTATAAIW